MLCSASVGTYIGISRARPPLGAPEPAETTARRLKFKQEHLGQARWAVIANSALLGASLVYLIIAHV
jgi:hypothetical protein